MVSINNIASPVKTRLLAPRLAAYSIVLAASVTLLILWNEDDWIKIPIILGIQHKSFEMLISRRSISRYITWVVTIVATMVYIVLSVTSLSYPAEPVMQDPSTAASALDFDISLIGKCDVPQISATTCFVDSNTWYASNYSLQVYDDLVEKGRNVLDKMQDVGTWLMTDEEWNECVNLVHWIVCGIYLPMCDYSCQPIPPCYSLCTTAAEACGTLRPIFVHYRETLEAVMLSVGASEETAQMFMTIMSDIFGECNETVSDESETLCMSADGYLTNLTGISPEGVCTLDNAEEYRYYIDSLQSTPANNIEALEIYEEALRRTKEIRMHIAISIVSCMILFLFIAFWYGSIREKVFTLAYIVDLDFLSLFCRLRVLIMSILGIILCFILQYTVSQLELTYGYLISMQIVIVLVGFSTSSALFLQDKIASEYVSVLTIPAEVNTVDLFAYMPLKLNGIYSLLMKFFSTGGKYEYWRYILSESIEVLMQLNVTFGLSRTEDTEFLMFYITLISINLIVSPILILNSSPIIWRMLNRIVDTALDICYIAVLYFSFISNMDNTNYSASDIVLGMIISSTRLASRIYFFSKLTVQSDVKRALQNARSKEVSDQDKMEGPSRIDKRIRFAVVCMFITSGTIFLVSSIYRIVLKKHDCEESLGYIEWNAIDNHVMFPEGLFGEISCNFGVVKTLNLSGLSLTDLSISLPLLENLETLDLSNNELSKIPVQYIELRNLKNLNLAGNAVSIELDWSQLDLNEFPTEILNLIPTLEKINLRDNAIEVIEGEILLMQLTYLDLSMNHLQKISPEYINPLESLEILNVSWNNLTEFDESIWSKSTLTILDVHHNFLTKVPYIWGLRLDGFHAEVKENPIEYVDWRWDGSNRRLTKLPDSFTTLKDIRYLDLSRQSIMVELESIMSLQNLEYLDLSFHQYVNWKPMTFLQKLEYLDVSYSSVLGNIDCLNRSLSYTRDTKGAYCDNNIKILNISGRGTDLLCGTAILTRWTSLEHIVALDLVNFTFTNISKNLENLKNLRTLNLRNSTITGFEAFSIPVNLTMVDVRNTSISLSEAQAYLPDFNCETPIAFVCTR